MITSPKGKIGRRRMAYLISAGMTVFYAGLIYFNREQYYELARFSPLPILFIAALTLLPDRAIANNLVFRTLGAYLPFSEAYGLTAVTTLANQLPFAGGIMAKGYYLKRLYSVPFTAFLTMTAGLFILAISGSGLVGLISLAIGGSALDRNFTILLSTLFVGMTISPLLLFIRPNLNLIPARWHTVVRHAHDGISLLSRDIELALKLTLLSTLNVALFGVRLWIAFRLLSTNVPIEYCLLFSSAALLTQLVSIAPAGLGVLEGIVATLGLVFGVDPAVSIVAVGLDRLITLAAMGIAGLLFAYILKQKIHTLREDSTPEISTNDHADCNEVRHQH